ncbi:hypothetical protein HGR_05236 [Hylemonella gracilis ATCC 19624]|uniref:Uncharacterized protein n=1 Tax=Hylemonella gracilis ATCC 19624 TaxID=887062 RepID=F3KRH0_9BURK|nr:hypothetical protein HGR_05236 [Hylemonella gracilis ATCC 19624]
MARLASKQKYRRRRLIARETLGCQSVDLRDTAWGP